MTLALNFIDDKHLYSICRGVGIFRQIQEATVCLCSDYQYILNVFPFQDTGPILPTFLHQRPDQNRVPLFIRVKGYGL